MLHSDTPLACYRYAFDNLTCGLEEKEHLMFFLFGLGSASAARVASEQGSETKAARGLVIGRSIGDCDVI